MDIRRTLPIQDDDRYKLSYINSLEKIYFILYLAWRILKLAAITEMRVKI